VTDPPYKPKLQYRRGSHAAWSAKNPLIAEGEPIYVTDKEQWKLGNGRKRYLDLPFKDSSDAEIAVSVQDLTDHINSEDPHPNYDDGRSLIVLYQNAKA
jgi:hypothetical protein